MKKRKNPWIQVFRYSMFLMVIFGGYYSLQAQSLEIKTIVLKALTNAAFVMVGFSLLLGPLAKFWDRFDIYLHYRKMLGVLGYYYLVLHAVFAMLLYVLPRGTYTQVTLFSLGFGMTGLLLFQFCTEISDINIIRAMGANSWRRTLRYLSYSGFIFGFVHLVIARWSREWLPYFSNSMDEVELPPLSLVVAIFSFMVLIFRFYTWMYDISKKT